MKNKIKKVVKQFKVELQELYGDNLDAVILYGSQVSGKANKDSDVDVLVVLNEMSSPYNEINLMVDIIHSHLLTDNELIQVIPTSKKSYMNDSNPLYRNIKKDGILI